MDINKEELRAVMKTPPVFIVGCQRSGTSFLYRTLSEILGIGFGRDNTMFANMFYTIDQYGDLNIDSNLMKFLTNIEDSPVFQKRFKQLRIANDEFISCIEDRQYSNIIRAIYAYWAITHGKKRWGGKTPDYTGHYKLLIDLFPDVKIIHVVRDGRDVALSFINQWWGPKDILVAADYWKKRIKTGASGKYILSPNVWYEIKYEDLLTCPQETFAGLLKFLQLDRDSNQALVDFEQKILPNIKKNNCYKWKKSFPNKDILLFEKIAGKQLEEYGYELINSNYHNCKVSKYTRCYHYAKNYFIKLTKGYIKRSISRKAFHYNYKK